MSEIIGTNGKDDLVGTSEDDVIRGLNGKDTLDGGDGNDVLDGGNGKDTLIGGDGDDTLLGGNGKDTLDGGDGDDVLDGGAGKDSLFGGLGDDRYIWGLLSGNDTIIDFAAGAGSDDKIVLQDTGLTDFADLLALASQSGSSTVITLASGARLTLENVNISDLHQDDFVFEQNGTSGDDIIDGGANDDVINAGDGNDNVNAGDGKDEVFGGDGDDVINGEDGNDVIQGEAGNDILSGGDGDDFLEGGEGNDILRGGAGNDTLIGDSGMGDDTLIGDEGDDFMDGGAGNDTVDYQSSTAGVQVHLTGGTMNPESVFGVFTWKQAVGGFADDGFGGFDTLANIENINGSAFDDNLFGNEEDNVLTGFNGEDLLIGGSGDDTLNGGQDVDQLFGNAGDDLMTGGAGDDTFYFLLGDDNDIITDFVAGSATSEDTIVLMDDAIPDFATLIGSQATDDGTDTTITLSSGETLVLKNVLVSQLDASDFTFATTDPTTAGNDVIIGAAGDDGFIGGQNGNDIIFGFDGSDVLFGDAGDDIVLGGEDNSFEFLSGGQGNDLIDGNRAIQLFNILTYNGEGGGNGVTVDLGLGRATDTFGDTDIVLNINAVRATDQNDTLLGGGSSFEDFRGLDGVDFIDGRDGTDRINFSGDQADGGNFGVTVDLGAGTATDGFGNNETFANIEWVQGTAFNDVLIGGDTASGFIGQASYERFEGGNGVDMIDGGVGFDEIAFNNDHNAGGGAIDLQFTGGGSGQVTDAFGNFELFYGIESVRGSVFDDTLTGSGDDERFRGIDGADTIDGGGGIDLVDYSIEPQLEDKNAVFGSSGVDVDLDTGGGMGSGTDSYGNVDTLKNIENVYGTRFADTITGDGLDNLLRGLGGNDMLTGELGNDTFVFDNVGGTATVTDFNAGAGAGDVLDIQAFGFADFAAVQAASTNVGLDVSIQLDGDDSVTLQNVQVASLVADDFLI